MKEWYCRLIHMVATWYVYRQTRAKVNVGALLRMRPNSTTHKSRHANPILGALWQTASAMWRNSLGGKRKIRRENKYGSWIFKLIERGVGNWRWPANRHGVGHATQETRKSEALGRVYSLIVDTECEKDVKSVRIGWRTTLAAWHVAGVRTPCFPREFISENNSLQKF